MRPEDQLSGQEGKVNDAKPKKVRRESSPDRWQRLVQEAKAAVEEAKTAVEDLNSMREEYGEKYDNMNEGLQASAYGQKCEAMQNLDLESAVSNLDDVISALEEAEGTEVPLGFGRD
jgi:cyclopropane fatty-acyl-phospholipid synthase-like methyltransferase